MLGSEDGESKLTVPFKSYRVYMSTIHIFINSNKMSS